MDAFGDDVTKLQQLFGIFICFCRSHQSYKCVYDHLGKKKRMNQLGLGDMA